MHIPDGYLSPLTYVPLCGTTFAFWSVALRKMKKELSVKHIPYLAMASVFAFLLMMFNIPIPGGTTGHAVGGGIIAILLGPWTAVIAVSVSVFIQAVVFGDGGITAIGANCFNMAVVMPFVSYWAFQLIRGKVVDGARLYVAAFFSGYLGLAAASIFTGLEFGLQPLIASGPDGRPLYAPYPMSVALPAIALQHLLVFGIVEGGVTAMLLKYFVRHESDLVYGFTAKGAVE